MKSYPVNKMRVSFDKRHILCIFTFPWKASHSGAQPPLGTVVGLIVVLINPLLLLQMDGSSTPQFMSFQ